VTRERGEEAIIILQTGLGDLLRDQVTIIIDRSLVHETREAIELFQAGENEQAGDIVAEMSATVMSRLSEFYDDAFMSSE
jgi:hypothetical protein